jgi:hypothetical protein
MSFTLDYPDAAKPSVSATVHSLSECYCRYLVGAAHALQHLCCRASQAFRQVILCNRGVITLPIEPHQSYQPGEIQPLQTIRERSATKGRFSGTRALLISLIALTYASVLVALLDEHEELMFNLLHKIEEKRNTVEVRALEEDLDDIDPDEVIKEM